jgi:hypothetical protein
MSRPHVAFIAKDYALGARCPVGCRDVTLGSENIHSRTSDLRLNAFRKACRWSKNLVEFIKTWNI